MVRTQIQLTEEQARRVRLRARRQGVSMADYIRRCIDLAPAEEADDADRYARAAALVGAFHDVEGRTDLSSAHDDLLDEGY